MRGRISTDEALEILGCSSKTLQRKIKSANLSVEKIGRDNYFVKAQIIKLVGEIKKNQHHAPLVHVENKIKEKLLQEQKEEERKTKLELAKQKLQQSAQAGDIGKRVISELTNEMQQLGTLKEIDRIFINDAAVAYERYVEYTQKALEHDCVVFTKAGIKEHPYLATATSFFNKYINLCTQLCITPAQRNKLGVKEESPVIDEMEGLLA